MNSVKARQQVLPDIIEGHAEVRPDELALTIVRKGAASEQFTYESFVSRVNNVARGLTEAGLSGQRALLVYPTGSEFAVALLACFRAGVVAVPTYPPSPFRPIEPFQAIARGCSAAAVLTTRQLSEELAARFATVPDLRVIATDGLAQEDAGEWSRPDVKPEDLAFLQYTSGTLGAPKGVMVSHANLVANLEMIRTRLNVRYPLPVGGWLPMFHDMGLIGTLLEPLYLGTPIYQMSPTDFLKRPLRWLEMISTFRIGFSGGPNFAYAVCASRITEEQKAGLDLSCWENAFNGAERVRADTLGRFADAFASCGFRREAFYPCYGMAEATLLVTGPVSGTPRPIIQDFDAASLGRGEAIAGASDPTTQSLSIVSCGKPYPTLTVEIVCPETFTRCPAGRVGEVWLSGPSMARGYWGHIEANAAFDAYILDQAGERVAGPFYRTGDMGLRHDDELYITGRLKDMIIVDGRNHYPEDIEATIDRCHPAVQSGAVAAFPIEGETSEELGVAIEIVREATRDQALMQEILQAVRQSVATEHEIGVSLAALVRAGSLPRTTSGKLKRRMCLSALQSGGMVPLASVGLTATPPSDEAPEKTP